MLKTLREISKKAILLGDIDVSEEVTKTKWLGIMAATEDEISITEERLNIKFPDDYIEFLKISNGFPKTSSISCSFLSVDKIDYLKTLMEDLVEIWNENDDLKEVGEALASAILIGGIDEEQQFMLIPPKSTNDQWRYWKFATWIPGEQEYTSLKEYFKSDLNFLKEQTKGLKNTKSKIEIDHSLRDAVYSLDWQTVYTLSSQYITENKRYNYLGSGYDIFALLLISASKTNRFADLAQLIQTFKMQHASGLNSSNFYLNNEHLLNKYSEAALGQHIFVKDFQMDQFTIKSNPMTLEDIEKQIQDVNKNLLKEKNKIAKMGYQLSFLFGYGSSGDFIQLYEQNHADLFYKDHYNAAIVYATLKQIEHSKEAMKRYFKAAFDFRPFDPFLCETLFPLLDEDFIKSLKNKAK
ncbi:MAG: SMI1/KNR4 family protein [Bacteroidetes bacterium]|nr:SMI1/KNR4 family protein [Bacteroidota bacterium]